MQSRKNAGFRRHLAYLLSEHHGGVVSAHLGYFNGYSGWRAQPHHNIIEFYYPRDIIAGFPQLIAAEQAAYRETAREDAEIIRRMEARRSVLYAAGRNEVGPYQSPMEDGIQHFHRFCDVNWP